ncbi:YdcH family protein [Hyphobacterium sp.]|uniref:YdcH family protein n=1 Tax=Hyphobacterium sp. TaxID=2004662 RepID=UPI0037481686
MIGRLNALKSRHSELEKKLSEEQSRPLPDSLDIATLKKMKLEVKDELQLARDSSEDRLRRRRRRRNSGLEYPGLGV